MIRTCVMAFVLLLLAFHPVSAQSNAANGKKEIEPVAHWWGSSVEKSLERAGDRRAVWQSALASTDDKYKVAMEFLISNMPATDFSKLSPEFLIENVQLAYTARAQVAWGKDIPESIFLNDVLPYCNINEPRDPWRKEFHERFIELAKSCKSPGEAARKLNETAFADLKVKYSTKRKRANQSPKESIEQGLASCTGLSILLVDACRSVCVPARLTGIAKWPKKNGNHTWVEVWDNDWHFAGAAEPSKDGLDHAWFQRDAATAIKDSPISSIMAVSFGKTETKWPLVWLNGSEQISVVNVTDRYTVSAKPSAGEAAATAPTATTDETIECQIVVRDAAGERVAAVVNVMDVLDATKSWVGYSRDESADTNNILLIDLPKSREFKVSVLLNGQRVLKQLNADDTAADKKLTIVLPVSPVSDLDAALAIYSEKFFSGDADAEVPEVSIDQNIVINEAHWKGILWEQYRKHGDHDALKADFEANRVRSGEYESPYVVKDVGKRGPNGWPLYIAMHGGGGAPKRVNDSQWKHMQIYYRDQAQLAGYKYLALRAPNDKWNGFYDDYVYPLIHELIRQQVILNDVDPNRVYIMGYSHGGYGAFAIGPKISDHFAAIHSSAAAPGGQTFGETLRNTRFTYMVGAKDTAHGRAKRCQEFAKSIDELRGQRTDIYPVTLLWKPTHGHGGLPDRDMVKDLYPFQRNPVPRELVWKMSDSVVKDFFWLSCDAPEKKKTISATCVDNRIEVNLPADTPCSIWLDSRLVDFTKPITATVNGEPLTVTAKPSVETMARSMSRRHDPFRTFSCEIKIPAQ